MDDYKAVDILIVEDNPADAELMLRALKKHNLANSLYIVQDGEEALDFIFCRGKYGSRSLHDIPKVVFLDLKLPKIHGLEVLKTLKNNEATKKLPIVVITGSREDPDINTAYALGANSYVIKPVDFDAFFKAMSTTGYYWLLVNQNIR
jgi:two-component system response regulator